MFLTLSVRIVGRLLKLPRNQNGKKIPLVLLVFLVLALAVSVASTVNAQTLTYTVDHEWAQVFINQDGTIDLNYNITVSVTQGTLHGFYAGAAQSRLHPRPSHRPIWQQS